MFKKLFKGVSKIFSKILKFIRKHWKQILIALIIALCVYGFYYYAVICNGSFALFANHLGNATRGIVNGFINNPIITDVIKKTLLPITITAIVSKNKWLIILAVISVLFLMLSRRSNESTN